tara:strand:- start:226388 stop:226897 length:510 start_codon:yes stop_codon:yes gene_type:complete
MIIREMVLADGGAVIDIYNRALRSGHASFQENGGTWSEWDGGHLLHCRYVADDGGGKVLGWAGLSSVSGRCAYAGVAEISVYVDPDFQGQAIGRQLLTALVEGSEQHGIWTLQAGVFPENSGSVALHQKHGFEILCRRHGFGRMTYGSMQGQWRDVLLLERRSKLVGID